MPVNSLCPHVFKIDSNLLAATLALPCAVIDGRTDIPVLRMLHLEVSGRHSLLRLTASDLAISHTETLTHDMPADLNLKLCIPGRAIAAALKHIKKQTLTIEFEGYEDEDGHWVPEFIILRAPGIDLRFQGMDATDFPGPVHTGHAGGSKLTLSADRMKDICGRVTYAVSTEETRYYLRGTYFCEHGGILRTVATDGHRMAIYDTPESKLAASFDGVILPIPLMKHLKRLTAADCEIEMRIFAADHSIAIISGASQVNAKLIDGTYPDYKAVIPSAEHTSRHLTFERVNFLRGIKILGGVQKVGAFGTTHITTNGDQLTLASKSPEGERTEARMLVEGSIDDDEIGFNTDYMKRLLDVLSDHDRLTLEMGIPSSPMVIRTEVPSTTHVLMPMRT